MKFESLSWQQKQALEKLYDQQKGDDKPQEPEWDPQPMSVRQVVQVEYGTDVYCGVKTTDGKHSIPTIKGLLRIVGNSEHVEIKFDDVRAIHRLIGQLETLARDIENFEGLAQAWKAARDQYQADKQVYERERENALREMLADGKTTEAQIEDMIAGVKKLDRIPW